MKEVIEVHRLREQPECFAVRQTARRIGPDDASGFRADHRPTLEHLKGHRQATTFGLPTRRHGPAERAPRFHPRADRDMVVRLTLPAGAAEGDFPGLRAGAPDDGE